MDESKLQERCFIIMPISTPKSRIEEYKGDADHFSHVLEHLFVPALKEAGFDPIPPKSTGSEIIQAEIIKQISECDLVLCDMSILNPNVFFEFGIRTALNKPVALVVDDKTVDQVPFDTSIINFHKYDSSLEVWIIKDEIIAFADHVRAAYKKAETKNALWKYFGVAQTGVFKPEEATIGEKLDLMMQEIASLKERDHKPVWFRATDSDLAYREAAADFLRSYGEKKKEKEDRVIRTVLDAVLKAKDDALDKK